MIYVGLNIVLARFGARHRKRSGDQQPSPDEDGSGGAIAIGALLDGAAPATMDGTHPPAGSGAGPDAMSMMDA